jgi:putative ABC transport system substrate-binding protein
MTRLSRYSAPLALICALVSFVAFAQSNKVYRIGVLETPGASTNRKNLDALLRGLREAGYIEGKNLIVDYRSADGRADRYRELAEDMVRAKPDIIVTRGTTATAAAKKAGSIPIVMTAAADPMGTGLVANLARPGGNVTGLTSLVAEIHGKRLGLIKELLPSVKRVGIVVNLDNANTPAMWQQVERAARSLGLQAQLVGARDANALALALETARKQGVGALLVNTESLMLANRGAIVAFGATHKLPVMYSSREFMDVGGLISYGVDYPALYYRAATYVDRILKGAKPGDLPIEQPTKFELVINLKTAKALGVQIPRELLRRADEVIQ